MDPGEGYVLYDTGVVTFLVRLSSDGEFISVFPAGIGILDPRDLVIDSNDNIYFAGVAIQGNNQNTFVSKLNEVGTQVWHHTFGGASNNTVPAKLAVDDNGTVIFFGYTGASSLDLDPGAGTNVTTGFGGIGGIICKLDVNGSHLWSGPTGGNGADYITGVDVDAAGAVYACSHFNNTTDLDAFATTQKFHRELNGVFGLLRYEIRCCRQRTIHSFGGPVTSNGGTDSYFTKDILLDRVHDKYYVSGILQSKVDFDPSANEVLGDYVNNNFITTYDLDGNFEMLRVLDGSSFDMFLKNDINGNVYEFGGVAYYLKVYTSKGPLIIPNPGVASLLFLSMSDCETLLEVSVALSPNPLVDCLDQTVTITATPANGGDNPSYECYWSNGNIIRGESAPAFSFLANGLSLTYACALISDEGCANQFPSLRANVEYDFSPSVTPTIYPVPEIFSPCPNETVLITAITTDEGIAPVYQCYVDGDAVEGVTGSTYCILDLPEQSEVTCRLISSEFCAAIDTLYSSAFVLFYAEMPNVNVFAQGNSVVGALDQSNDYQWIDCDTGQDISGETQHFYAFEESGTYALIASNFFCADTSECVSVTFTPTRAEEWSAIGFSLPPNPSNGEVRITVSSGNPNMIIRAVIVERRGVPRKIAKWQWQEFES